MKRHALLCEPLTLAPAFESRKLDLSFDESTWHPPAKLRNIQWNTTAVPFPPRPQTSPLIF
ncbi:hypothetical protein OKW43_008143 [Paraburkholderia sp. WC7.3g]